ncbi:hypothetical protein MMC19_001952 [Ptychographa xylographoides]|nr:hypothetical protein [Ptychographa xylographoides]
MQTFLVATVFAALTACVSAAPTPQVVARQFEVQVTFIGAADAEYTLSIPADGSLVTIDNHLSVSKISSAGGASCSFRGIDGSDTTVVGAQTVDVGPPQTQTQGSCLAF